MNKRSRRSMSKAASSLVAFAAAVSFAHTAGADVITDRAAAVLIFPRIIAARQVFASALQTEVSATDTEIQITNTTSAPLRLSCFYVDATPLCSLSGTACPVNSFCPLPQDICLPKWVETDFRIFMTPQQPLAWRVSLGMSGLQFPLDGRDFNGPGNQNNAGSAIPPLPAHEFPPQMAPPGGTSAVGTFTIAELECIVVDDAGFGAASNSIKGEATITTSETIRNLDPPVPFNSAVVERYNAVGIEAIGGDVNRDNVLELSDALGEYDGCPNVLILENFFDGPEFGPNTLTLVPCQQNLRDQIPGSTTAQFLVFNEFEQRFSTSTLVSCLFSKWLSLIDTNQPGRSIFSAAVAGTGAGQTRIRGVQGGLIGVLSRGISSVSGVSATNNIHRQGRRDDVDQIILP